MTTAKRDAMSVEGFSHRVELACADLPDPVRHRLIADLNVHLRELDEGADLLAVLGPPEDYARDLREALDLPEASGAPARPPTRGRWSSPGHWPAALTGRRRIIALIAAGAVIVLIAVIGFASTNHSGSAPAPATPAPTVAINGSTDVIAVPPVVGLSLANAELVLQDQGLQVDVLPTDQAADDNDRVIAQTPPDGTLVANGSTVTLQLVRG